jgi:hypothetical protein
VVWDAENADGEDRGVLLRLFDSAGQPVSDRKVVNQTVQSTQSGPGVTGATGADRVLVAWTSLSMADGEDVFVRLFDGAGQAVDNEFRVNTQVPGDQSQAVVTTLETDLFLVAWAGYSSEFAGTDVFARLLDVDGNPVGNPFMVHEAFLNDQEQPTVAPVGGDQPGFLVGWTQAAGSPGGVYLRRFDLEGQPVGGAEVLVDAFGQPQEAALDIAPNGTTLLCWRVGDKVLCQLLDEDLAMVGAQFESASGTQPGAPTVLWRADDRVWIMQDELDIDADGRGIRRRDFNPNGVSLSPFALMNTGETGDQTESFTALLATGQVVTGWTGIDDGIFVRVME